MSTSSSSSPSFSQKRVWRKILYEKQPAYSDNFYDPDKFLDSLQAQRIQRPLTRYELIICCSYIVQQFIVMTIFFSIYKYLVIGRLKAYHLLAINTSSTLFGGSVYFFLEESYKLQLKSSVWEYLRSLFIFVVCLRYLLEYYDFIIQFTH